MKRVCTLKGGTVAEIALYGDDVTVTRDSLTLPVADADPVVITAPDGCTFAEHTEAAVGWPVKSGKPVRPPVTARDLEAAKAVARSQIIGRANRFTAPILMRYPEAERAGWPKREAEARTIIAASDKAAAIAATQVIKVLAAAAGEDTAATVARAETIAAKADGFAAISAAVEMMRAAALSAIDAVTDVADMPATLAALEAQALALAEQHGLA